jgi:hypothetical protein
MSNEHEENFDPDLVRSDWEGMPQRSPEYEDKELTEFLLMIKTEFWQNKKNGNIEKAAISLVERLGEEGMKPFLPMVERHFFNSVCLLHERDLVCDSNKLLEAKEDEISIVISRETLNEHMKWFLGEKEWKILEDESTKRLLTEDKRDAGTAG